ncbi:MAG: acyltransferase [Bacteroidales bacterium]|jgi:phenylacetate-coenzyme A ligase PaaK-like adenylate-forming protein|nr:acyltransferase [Bacteroidales bacterium]
MPEIPGLTNRVFSITSTKEFNDLAVEIFHFQFKKNITYREYVENLGLNLDKIDTPNQIPFIPISFFKNHTIITGTNNYDHIFTSSGTTGKNTSKHYIRDLSVYEQSFRDTFTIFFGDIKQYVILALLPSYLEREGSSLVYMADKLIADSNHPESGFYLDEYEKLISVLNELKIKGKRVILLGVTYALLDLAENYHLNFPELIIMETGGMKGRRKEMIREEVHEKIKKSYGVPQVFSEYGMTELLSQAYSNGNGEFTCPPWMQVLIRDVNDPFSILKPNCTGGINVIDLANIYSCSFIETQDLGKISMNNTFEVLGRFDNSDVRGCNLLIN